MKMIELYPAGHSFTVGQKHFTAESIIRFATKFDPQPFHMDEEAAKAYVFGALCASGWQTCAEWMRCFVDYWVAESARMVQEGVVPPKVGPSPGFKDLQWLKPVYAGDTITYTVTMLESRPLASRPGWILNHSRNEGINQSGEPVMRFTASLLEFE